MTQVARQCAGSGSPGITSQGTAKKSHADAANALRPTGRSTLTERTTTTPYGDLEAGTTVTVQGHDETEPEVLRVETATGSVLSVPEWIFAEPSTKGGDPEHSLRGDLADTPSAPPDPATGPPPPLGREASPARPGGGPSLPDPPSGARVLCLGGTDKWRQLRTQGIGSSEAASVLGQGYRSPLEVYARKIGKRPPPDGSLPEYVEAGRVIEPFIAYWYSQRRGFPATSDQRMLEHPKHPFMRATCDFLQTALTNRGRGVLEVKNVGSYKRKEWEHDAPVIYQIQLQHQLLVTGYKWGTLCALLGGSELVWYDYEAHPGFQRYLLKKCKAFWKAVEAQDPSGLKDGPDMKGLKLLYPEDDGSVVELPDEASDWDDAWVRAKERESHLNARLKEAKKNRQAIEAKICAKIGAARYGEIEGVRYEWETRERKGYVVDDKKYRKLRRHEWGGNATTISTRRGGEDE